MSAELKFSVITPSFNQGRFIRRTIDSVLEQGWPNFEHIVIDGGSTDETVEILKSYPHLQWVSEKDNGQTDALNKGFARASGDIIAWINSDDWYAPGAFGAVAPYLQEYPVIVGACDITDGGGRPTERIFNARRSWLDILKYWVPYSIPTQPSIFFHRRLLQEFMRSDGRPLDVSLNYCMDFDLWGRVFQKYQFRRIEPVLSYYRMYEDNKTGTGMDPLKPEMSRVFRRYERAGRVIERVFTIAVAAREADEKLTGTLRALERQQLKDFEVLLVDCAGTEEGSKAIRAQLRAAKHEFPNVRYVRASGRESGSAYNAALSASCSLYLVYLEAGAAPQSDLLLKLVEILAGDSVGAVLLAAENSIGGRLASGISVDSILRLNSGCVAFAVRTLAASEIAALVGPSPETLFVRSLLLSLLHKGWDIELLSSPEFSGLLPPRPLTDGNDEFVNARLILALHADLVSDEFALNRAGHKRGIVFDAGVIEQARGIAAGASI